MNHKSITIHNLDELLESAIREKARQQNASLNKTIQAALKAYFGLSHDQSHRKSVFMDLFGSWSKKDEKEFQVKNKQFEKIDNEDWS